MQVHVSIGENHRFELREALLVYGDRQRSFVTRHQVALHKDAPPTLEAAQPLTLGFLESLVRSLVGGSTAEVLPENVLAKGDRMIVWWTPVCRRQMFYENSEKKAAQLNGRTFPQPPLVWRVDNGDLKIRALLRTNGRPQGRSWRSLRSGTSLTTAASAPARCAARTAQQYPRSPTGSGASMRAPLLTPMSAA